MKRILTIFTAAIMLCTLFGCSASKPVQQENKEKTKLTLVLDWVPNTNHTGLYAAQSLGYFSEENLEVNIVQPPEDGADALVASGKAQFGISFQDTIANSLTADAPLPVTAVAAVVQHNTSGIISLKDKGIVSAKDMAGHKYATWDSPIEKAILKDVISKDGGDYSKVEMIPSTVTDVPTALTSDIDAVWVFYGWDGVATALKGIDTNFFYFKDANPSLDYYTPVIIGNNEFLKNDPQTAKAFLKAVKKGYEYCIQNPDKAADILCTAAPETDKALALESQKYLASQYQADAAQWGIIDPARWDSFYAFLFSSGAISKEIPAGAGFSNDYISAK